VLLTLSMLDKPSRAYGKSRPSSAHFQSGGRTTGTVGHDAVETARRVFWINCDCMLLYANTSVRVSPVVTDWRRLQLLVKRKRSYTLLTLGLYSFGALRTRCVSLGILHVFHARIIAQQVTNHIACNSRDKQAFD